MVTGGPTRRTYISGSVGRTIRWHEAKKQGQDFRETENISERRRRSDPVRVRILSSITLQGRAEERVG